MKAAPSLAILACATVLACGGADKARAGDDARAGAIALPPGGLVMDLVDAEADDTDFVRFELPASTVVTVRVDWNRPGVQARIRVLDAAGKRVAQADHGSGSPVDLLAGIALDDGSYFVELTASKGASAYSLAVIPAREAGADGVPRPE